MADDNRIDRRRLLKSIAAGGALVKWPALAGASADGARGNYAVFSPPQAESMESLVDLLIPADDFPGAKEAGVVHSIDQKLAGPFGNFFTGHYEAGLKQLDAVSRAHFHRGFALLEGGQQSSLLHAIENGAHGPALHDFFQTVLSDTFEGYYGRPEDGGNRNGASWKMIGFKG